LPLASDVKKLSAEDAMTIATQRLNDRVSVNWPAHVSFGRSALAMVEVQNASSQGARLVVPPQYGGHEALEALAPGACLSVMLFPRTHAFYATSCLLQWIGRDERGNTQIEVTFLDPIAQHEFEGMLSPTEPS
jgi:hypothetical protein